MNSSHIRYMWTTAWSLGAGVLAGALLSSLFTTAIARPRHHRGQHSRRLGLHADLEFAATLLPESHRLQELGNAAPDIAAFLPLQFESAFDNPCFLDVNHTLRCLPAFFLAGAMQCGSGDLWRRLRDHAHVAGKHDALSHWWTLHPRSRAGTFERYLALLTGPGTRSTLDAEPKALLGEASPATFAFMMAEQLRLHYLYLDAFSACHGRCRSRKAPAKYAAACADRKYDMQHCFGEANNATVSVEFNLPSLILTTYGASRVPKVIALLRDPTVRLWIAFWNYGQYPGKYGQSAAGFRYYFGNQSAAFDTCVATEGRGRRKCALRFEGYGAAEGAVFYHCDQLIKGMYMQPWLTQRMPPPICMPSVHSLTLVHCVWYMCMCGTGMRPTYQSGRPRCRLSTCY